MTGRIIWSALAVFLFFAPPGFAQQKSSADDIVANMTSKLKLTSDQAALLKPVIEYSFSQRQQIMQTMRDEMVKIRGQMDQLNSDEKQKLSKILTKAQMSKWLSMQNHKHSRRHIVNQMAPLSASGRT